MRPGHRVQNAKGGKMLTDLKDPTECRCIIDSHDVIAAIRSKETSAILVEEIFLGELNFVLSKRFPLV